MRTIIPDETNRPNNLIILPQMAENLYVGVSLAWCD